MTDKIIVMVSDPDNGIRGEINVLESPDEAAHLVESLIESGFDQGRIRVFLGGEMEMEVHHRPVVNLLSTPNSQGNPPPQREAPAEELAATAEPSAPSRTNQIEEPAAPAEPFVKNGERFSSQFRPDESEMDAQ